MCNETYTVLKNKDGSLKHSNECKMAFGKKDPKCPRCVELINGAQPRKAWDYLSKQNEANRIQAIREHDCKKSGCGPVCTFGDW
jgi:hypothetical protein